MSKYINFWDNMDLVTHTRQDSMKSHRKKLLMKAIPGYNGQHFSMMVAGLKRTPHRVRLFPFFNQINNLLSIKYIDSKIRNAPIFHFSDWVHCRIMYIP